MYYVTPKNLKEEVRVIHETIKDAANDLGGDINYLNDNLKEMEERIKAIEEQLSMVIEDIKQWQTKS